MDQLEQPPDSFKNRELEILGLIGEGYSNTEIAQKLFLSTETIRWYNKQIYSKLGTSRRTEAVAVARSLGLLTADATSFIQGRTEPEIRSTTAPLHNLPYETTPFVGRRTELADLTKLLRERHIRLITIIAPGGMGKTRIALEVARQHISDFSNGIYFVPLQALTAIEQIVPAVASCVSFSFQADGRSPKQQLLDFLANKQLLLLIDNWEHLLDGAPLVNDILNAAPEVKILAASREKLNLLGETVYVLHGLEFPTWAVPEDALQYEAVQLLVQAAQRIKPDWEVNQDNLDYVARVCRLTQGMPLGILLAVSWLDVYSLERICDEIQKSIDILETEMRDVPERQRSIRGVFDYSWNSIRRTEQDVLMKMSIFRGGCSPQAAEKVAGASPRVLQGLVNKALLSKNQEGRYDIHELLRQYAEERLYQSGQVEATCDNFCRYFADFMQSFENDLRVGTAQESLQAILPEQANLRVFWQRAVQSKQWQVIADCLDSTHYFYMRKGLFSEQAKLVDDAITALQATMEQDDDLLNSLLSQLLTMRAWGYLQSAQFDEGMKTAEQACELAQRVGSAGIEARIRVVMAKLFHRDHAAALAQNEKAVALAKAAQDPILEADILGSIGNHLLWQGKVEAARETLQHALNLCQRLQYKPGELDNLNRLARVAQSQGAYSLSAEYNEQALQLCRQSGDTVKEALTLGNLATSLTMLRDLAGARRCQEESLATYRRLNMPANEEVVLGGLGQTAKELGDYAVAEQSLTEALAIARKIKDVFFQAWIQLRLGEMWHERGESEKGILFITEAHRIAEQVQNLRFMAAVLYAWGNALLNLTDWAQAEQKYQESYDLWQGLGQVENATQSLAGLAYVAYQQHMLEIAAAHAEHLWQTWQETPAIAERAGLKLYWMLGMVWDGLGDSRANSLWKKARTLLYERSEEILDDDARKMFLEQVPVHQAVLKIPI